MCLPVDCSDGPLGGWSQNVLVATSIELCGGGHPGHALDIDENPATCAPVGDCEQGLDNQYSGIMESLSDFYDCASFLDDMIISGSLIVLAEHVGAMVPEVPFSVRLYLGLAEGTQGQCDLFTETCPFLVDEQSFSEDACAPIIEIDNAVLSGTAVSAGGPGYSFTLSVTIDSDSGSKIPLTLRNLKLEGELKQKGTDFIIDGVVGGAIVKAELIGSIEVLPDDVELPVSKDMMVSMLQMMLEADLDLDGDGTAESISICAAVSTNTAKLVGVGQAE